MTEPRRAQLIKRGGRSTGGGGMITITDAGIDAVEEAAREGLGYGAVAQRLQIDRETLMRLRERDPRVNNAFDRGRAALEEKIASKLIEKADKGDTVALIFLAKARLGWRDRDDDGTTIITNVQTSAVATMTLPEIRQRIELLEREKRLLAEARDAGT